MRVSRERQPINHSSSLLECKISAEQELTAIFARPRCLSDPTDLCILDRRRTLRDRPSNPGLEADNAASSRDINETERSLSKVLDDDMQDISRSLHSSTSMTVSAWEELETSEQQSCSKSATPSPYKSCKTSVTEE